MEPPSVSEARDNTARKGDMSTLALDDVYISTFWEKKNTQYKTLQASYVQKRIQSSVSIEVDESILADLNENNARGFSEKRRFDAAEEETKKKAKTAVEEEKEEKKKEKKDRHYILDFMEINAINVAELKIHKLKKNLSVEERLALSSIKISDQAKLPQYQLSDNSYVLIKRWKKALDDNEELFLQQPPPTNREEMAIANTLSTLFLFDKESTRKTGGAVRHKYNQSEIDFIIKFGSVLVQNTFASSNKISIDWDISSFSLMEEVPKEYLTTRLDIIMICYKGIEVGCGEVKPPKKSKELIDIDRARIAEVCKRQLHLRLQISSSIKEHCTFGALIGGMVLELTKLQFDNGEYNYSILKTIEMPGQNKTGGSIEEILESLYSFKQVIEQSLPSEGEKPSSLSFDQYSELLKPTIRFLKSP
ncbi:hypothetical protein G6F37_006898 [Rhizopus arrhizus]|nr:hypothetical protein G6F38_008914 [Rhizopus arrhizus]KAG1157218.1 hypothetical protein G6F37_006898 [Rhizopus arrhizus]